MLQCVFDQSRNYSNTLITTCQEDLFIFADLINTHMLYKIFYTDRFIPDRFAAFHFGPFVFIRPKYKDDIGLKMHELTHVNQFYRNPLMGLFYRFSEKYRLKCEVEAYKVQLQYYSLDQSALFADYIATKYDLDITQEQAKKLLLS